MERAPTLHLACMPFPTAQGTQAVVAAMMRALHAEGRVAHLLTYAHRAEPEAATHVQHRLSDLPRLRSERSGPSIGKAALDLRMIAALRRLHRRLRPDAVVAHNVEAALVAAAARVGPRVYLAHTLFAAELPYYGAPRLGPALARAGEALDRLAVAPADAVAALCPSLAEAIESRRGVAVAYAPAPWAVAPPLTADERGAARASLGVPARAELALYAGNLDAYQGWEDVVAAVASVPDAWLLVATESDPSPLRAAAAARGLGGRLLLAPLAGEAARRRAHAAADAALVPRRAPGGLPVKLLDALARGVPVVATRRATGGLALGEAAVVVEDDSPRALARGFAEALGRPALRVAGPRYVAGAHSAAAFVSSLDAAVAGARAAAPA